MRKLISDIGHIILQVGDMDKAVKLYCETLGFELDPLVIETRTKQDPQQIGHAR